MKIKIGIAKPSDYDIEAAEVLCQALNLIDNNNSNWHCASIKGAPDLFEIDGFDPEEPGHAQAFYNTVIHLLHKYPSFHNRVISGMCHVIMWDKNQIIDPDSHIIDLHPRFEEMWNDLQRETQAARYWNKRYHELLNQDHHENSNIF